MAIDFKKKEYNDNINKWKLTDNVCEYNDVEQYLIPLNPHDKSQANVTRNNQYKKRAVFYPVTGYTLQGMIGLLFNKQPKIELPSQLEYMLDNVDGTGVSLYQQSQDVAADLFEKGRGGLFTSYPKTEGMLSRAQMDEGAYVATINEIEAEQIINWATTTIGSKVVLSLVVFMEEVEEITDYETKTIKQIKELALEDGLYVVREWRKDEKDDQWIVHDESMPTDAKGNRWKEIPFVFLGSMANVPDINEAPLYPLAKINIAHYRNSADYEDSVWYAGQAQPYMTGITQNHIDLMKENEMYVGSRQLLGVPSGESFGFASAEPNTMVRQAMLDKLDMMIGLGARFIQENGRAKTATEDDNDANIEHSTLSLISANLSEGYTQAIEWAAKYQGADESSILFETSQEFVNPKATAQEIQAVVAGFVQGAIPLAEYFRWLKKVDMVDSEKTIEEFDANPVSSVPLEE